MQWAIKNGYEVHAFEPNPRMKERLEPYRDKATIHYAAAWNENGESPFYDHAEDEVVNDDIDQGRTLIFEKKNIDHSKSDVVRTINIGEYLHNLNKDIDILKVDTEGADYYILESILDHFNPKRIKIWLMEDHSNHIEDVKWREHKAKVLKRLKDNSITILPW